MLYTEQADLCKCVDFCDMTETKEAVFAAQLYEYTYIDCTDRGVTNIVFMLMLMC